MVQVSCTCSLYNVCLQDFMKNAELLGRKIIKRNINANLHALWGQQGKWRIKTRHYCLHPEKSEQPEATQMPCICGDTLLKYQNLTSKGKKYQQHKIILKQSKRVYFKLPSNWSQGLFLKISPHERELAKKQLQKQTSGTREIAFRICHL